MNDAIVLSRLGISLIWRDVVAFLMHKHQVVWRHRRSFEFHLKFIFSVYKDIHINAMHFQVKCPQRHNILEVGMLDWTGQNSAQNICYLILFITNSYANLSYKKGTYVASYALLVGVLFLPLAQQDHDKVVVVVPWFIEFQLQGLARRDKVFFTAGRLGLRRRSL